MGATLSVDICASSPIIKNVPMLVSKLVSWWDSWLAPLFGIMVGSMVCIMVGLVVGILVVARHAVIMVTLCKVTRAQTRNGVDNNTACCLKVDALLRMPP